MLFETIKASLDHNGLVPGRDRLVLGVSGGVDSMVLLYALNAAHFSLFIVHVNYHKRGEESDMDQILVEKAAQELGFPCYVHTVYPEDAVGNFQEWARKERYRVFDQKRKESGASAIVVAHHQDDQLETILQKMLRGAGLDSWQGMTEFDGVLLRPLLDIPRLEILQYARQNGIVYRDDQSNFESGYARNFIRNEWMPEMDRLFPGWRSNVLGISQKAALFDESMAILAGQIEKSPGVIDREKFLGYSHEMQKGIVLHIIKTLFGRENTISTGALETLSDLQGLQTGSKIQLGDHLFILRNRNEFHFIQEAVPYTEFEPVVVSFDQVCNHALEIGEFRLEYKKCNEKDYGRALYLNLKSSDWPITIRNWKDGDAFQPFGMKGHQKVSDFLTNRKISSAKKNDVLVILSFEETICAIIFPHSENQGPGSISDVVKCDENSENALIIEKI